MFSGFAGRVDKQDNHYRRLHKQISLYSAQRCLYLSKILFSFSLPEREGDTTLPGAAGFVEGLLLVVLLKTGEGERARDMEMEPKLFILSNTAGSRGKSGLWMGGGSTGVSSGSAWETL